MSESELREKAGRLAPFSGEEATQVGERLIGTINEVLREKGSGINSMTLIVGQCVGVIAFIETNTVQRPPEIVELLRACHGVIGMMGGKVEEGLIQ